MNKKEKAVKALRLLFIGELLIILGLLSELGFIYEPLVFIALISFVGLIISLVGIIKLAKVNYFFLISCISVATSLLIGAVTGTLSAIGISKETLNILNSIFNIVGKGLSFIFVFGIIRGCSKAATGSARSKIATIMTLINFTGKALAIVFLILAGIYESNQNLFNGFVLVSTISAIIVDIAFVWYLFVIYKKAKSSANI